MTDSNISLRIANAFIAYTKPINQKLTVVAVSLIHALSRISAMMLNYTDVLNVTRVGINIIFVMMHLNRIVTPVFSGGGENHRY
jgi:hypothetical protein